MDLIWNWELYNKIKYCIDQLNIYDNLNFDSLLSNKRYNKKFIINLFNILIEKSKNNLYAQKIFYHLLSSRGYDFEVWLSALLNGEKYNSSKEKYKKHDIYVDGKHMSLKTRCWSGRGQLDMGKFPISSHSTKIILESINEYNKKINKNVKSVPVKFLPNNSRKKLLENYQEIFEYMKKEILIVLLYHFMDNDETINFSMHYINGKTLLKRIEKLLIDPNINIQKASTIFTMSHKIILGSDIMDEFYKKPLVKLRITKNDIYENSKYNVVSIKNYLITKNKILNYENKLIKNFNKNNKS